MNEFNIELTTVKMETEWKAELKTATENGNIENVLNMCYFQNIQLAVNYSR